MNPPYTLPSSVIELLSDMISFDTVSGPISGRSNPEADLCNYLEWVATSWGFGTQRLKVEEAGDNLLVFHPHDLSSQKGGRNLLFVSHTDTVSTAGMTVSPLKATVWDDKIFGRGSCDTKGTGASMLWALKQYVASGRLTPLRAILFSVNEEAGMRGAKAFCGDYIRCGGLQIHRVPYEISGIVVGEPTMLRPVIAHNGAIRFSYATHGVAAHSSDPSRGRSAISSMCKVIAEFEASYAALLSKEHTLTGRAVSTLNQISGGTSFNVIPELCEVWGDRRMVPGEKPSDVERELAEALHKAVVGSVGITAKYQTLGRNKSFEQDPRHPFIGTVQAVLERFGLNEECTGVPYCTEAGEFGELNLPCVVMGPGDVAQAHTKDEWLSLEQLEWGVKVYRAVMEEDPS